MTVNESYKKCLELRRWLVFLLIVIPLLPVAIVASLLGTVWAVAKECFLAGAAVLDVYVDDPEKK